MLHIVLFLPRANQNIIHIYHNIFIEQVIQDQIHAMLKVIWCILESKGHHTELMHTIPIHESTLKSILPSQWNLEIAISKVYFR